METVLQANICLMSLTDVGLQLHNDMIMSLCNQLLIIKIL